MTKNLIQTWLPSFETQATWKEIHQQPETWVKTDALVAQYEQEIKHFLADDKNRQIIITGAGSSAFIGNTIEAIIAKYTNAHVAAIDTTSLLSHPDLYLRAHKPLLLVSFGRSGNSPESIAVCKLVNQLVEDVKEIVITCNENGQLAQRENNPNLFTLVLPKETHDQGFAMTSSFTSMMLACLKIFNIPIPIDLINTAAQNALSNYLDLLELIANKDFERIVFLGSGPLEGLAKECSLKLLELTAGKVTGFHNTPLGFRHGPKSLLGNKTLTVMFASDNAYVRQYELDLVKEIKLNSENKLFLISNIPFLKAEEYADYSLSLSSSGAILQDEYLSFAFIGIVQLLAFLISAKLGISPDNPSPSGEVNRVVQGVFIHNFNNTKAVL